MIYEWVAFLDTLDNPQGAHEGLAHTLELIEMPWYHMIKICPFFHIVVQSRTGMGGWGLFTRLTIGLETGHRLLGS